MVVTERRRKDASTSAAAAAVHEKNERDHEDDDHAAAPPNPRVVPPNVSLGGLLCIGYAAMWFLAGQVVAPGGGAVMESGAVWSVVFIWLGAQIGGATAGYFNLPPLLGMLLSGMLLRNLPGDLVEDLPKEWSGAIRSAGLSVILMRSGLELDLEAFKQVGWMAVRLTAMPGASEAVVAGAFATVIFGMHLTLGLSLGFILGAVSPAVVVLGMFELQSRGFGVAKGIPSLVVAAASFDDVVAISGYTIFKSFALSAGHGGLAWTILHGPVDMVAGVTAGALAGVLASATAVWDTRAKRSAIIFLLGMLLMFAGKYVDFSGGGAMGGLCMGIVANKLWASGWAPGGERGRLSLGPDEHFAHEVEGDLALAWKTLFQPLLFGVIGSAIKFANLSPATIPRSILLILIGLCVRLPAAFFACSFGALNLKEKLFIALSWMPKATVQAALASDPLETILEHKHDEANFEEWEQWGNEILTTAVFSIILTAPLGMLIINFLGPRWLSQDVNPETKAIEALAVVHENEHVHDQEEVFLDLGGDDQDEGEVGAQGAQGAGAGEAGAGGAAAQGHIAAAGSRVQRASSSLPPRSTSPPVVGANTSQRPTSRTSFEGGTTPRGSLNEGGGAGGGSGGRSLRPSVNWMMSSHEPSPSNTLDAAAKLEILTSSLRLQIEEQFQSGKSATMLGSLDAISQLCHSRMAPRHQRPSVRLPHEPFDVPGQFFRQQKEDNVLLDASANVLSHSHLSPPPPPSGGVGGGGGGAGNK